MSDTTPEMLMSFIASASTSLCVLIMFCWLFYKSERLERRVSTLEEENLHLNDTDNESDNESNQMVLEV